MAKQKQMIMKGVNTTLSNACDDFVEASDELTKAKEYVDESKNRLAEILKSEGKKSVRHAGVTIVLREGRTTKDSVTIKKEF
jgi:hypothetical protein